MTICANRFFRKVKPLSFCIAAVVLLASALPASAKVVLLLEEPYSYDGRLAGTGHAAVYLTDVCAASPVSLRRCNPGERGVVISRYYKIDGYDWLAIPLIPYLYAVENLDDVPIFADEQTADFLRDRYRRNHLEAFAPDEEGGRTPAGHWIEVVGVAYRRTIYAYQIDAGEAKDDAFIREFNARPNHGKFNLVTHNCADFARNVVDFYYPKAVHRSIFGDLGVTTPKQLGRTILHYSQKHPQLNLTMFVIPQVPGTIPRSRQMHGVIESAFGAKKYLLPIFLVHPVVAATLAVGTYMDEGHANIVHDPLVFDAVNGLQSPLGSSERRSYQEKLDGLRTELEPNFSSSKISAQLEHAKVSLDESGRPILREAMDTDPVSIPLTRSAILQSSAPDGFETALLLERISQELKRGTVPKASGADVKEDWSLLEQIEERQKRRSSPNTLTASDALRTQAQP